MNRTSSSTSMTTTTTTSSFPTFEKDFSTLTNDLTERAANLQSFNMDFVKKLDTLKQDYCHLTQVIHQEETKKMKLEKELQSLQVQLSTTNTNLQHLSQLSKKIKETIKETELGYHQILTSSESLLKGLYSQSDSIKDAMHKLNESL